MTDLKNYQSQQSKIETLEAEIVQLKRRAKIERDRANKYKIKWQKLGGKPRVMNR